MVSVCKETLQRGKLEEKTRKYWGYTLYVKYIYIYISSSFLWRDIMLQISVKIQNTTTMDCVYK